MQNFLNSKWWIFQDLLTSGRGRVRLHPCNGLFLLLLNFTNLLANSPLLYKYHNNANFCFARNVQNHKLKFLGKIYSDTI